MVFENREDAARKLIPLLKKYQTDHPLVLGIPRGAMPMAKIIADELNGELGTVLVHKIPHPSNEELAVASISLSGSIYELPSVEELGISEQYLKAEGKNQLARLKLRQKKFDVPDLSCNQRTVLVVDDGIATGATVFGALHEIRSQNPKKIILAAAVCAPDTAERLKPLAC